MDILDCMKQFSSWPVEVQSACVYQFQNRPEPSRPVEQKVVVAKTNRNNQRWTDDERLELFELFERYGWNRHLATGWARRFGRKVSSLRGQFDHNYQSWKPTPK